MHKLQVMAAFDWLDNERMVGILGYENIRGSQIYSFEYDDGWLRDFPDIILSDDLQSFPGIQYVPDGDNKLFGCFSDVLPDRWGRRLADLKADLANPQPSYLPRKQPEWQYLTAVSDLTRMGGFRFKDLQTGLYINTDAEYAIPPMIRLGELTEAAHNIENSFERKLPPDRRWVNRLFNPGSSVGGARPKACVLGEDGHIYIAKFPSVKDDYDMAKWECLATMLAKDCGIETPHTRLVPMPDGHSIFLTRRFDRTDEGRRIHMASSLTLLGLKDGSGSSTGHGYVDMVDFIITCGSRCEQQLEQLYRRVAFNVCIGNTDDHFRNHAFLLGKDGWRLSPAYDMNPTRNLYHAIDIADGTNLSDLTTLYKAHEQYMLSDAKAAEIISDVARSIKYWQSAASALRISGAEQRMMHERLKLCSSAWERSTGRKP